MQLFASLTLALATLGLGAAHPGRRSISSGTGASLFSRDDVSIGEAPASHQLALGRGRRPGVAGGGGRLHARNAQPPPVGSEAVHSLFSGVYPTINVTWGDTAGGGGQTFLSILDTGSGDTWVVSRDFRCADIATNAPLDQARCQFGPGLDAGRAGFANLTDQEFSVSFFPEGDTVAGSFGTVALTVGGVTVPQQQAALVESAAWQGNGYTSGILGLAYPGVTASLIRASGDPRTYDPWFTTAVKEHRVPEAVFTLALDRLAPGTPVSAAAGLAAFGGLVPASYYQPPFTSVPIEPFGGTGEALSFYIVTARLVFRAEDGSLATGGEFQAIVDSGTAPNFVPSPAAEDLNALFRPPAVYNASLGFWTVPCNATPPYAAFVIGDVEMPMDPRDMVVRSLNGLPGYEDVCFSPFNGTEPFGDGSFLGLIGEVWQRSYVVAYDQGRTVMHFAPRKPY